MSESTLLVVAGCNGSGKSSFSKQLVSTDFLPFDYDIHFLKAYASLRDSDIREEMAHNIAFRELENQIAETIAGKSTVRLEYECNAMQTTISRNCILTSILTSQ